MTRLAIGKTAVVKGKVFPTSDDVTVGTLAFIVVLWTVVLQVTGLAVSKAVVVKGGNCPVSGVGMTIHTDAGKLTSRDRFVLDLSHARYRPYSKPCITIQTHIVIGRAVFEMTRATFGDVSMIISYFLPVIETGMTRGACIGVVISRVILDMARQTSDDTNVIKLKRGPTVCVVAVLTGAREMVGIERIKR